MEINFKSRLKSSEVSSASILIIIISFFPPALYNFPANEATLRDKSLNETETIFLSAP